MAKQYDLKHMSKKDYISIFFKGILLGLISVGIPGISASTIGVIIGTYFILVDGIANIFQDFKHSFPFLIDIMIGYALGAVGASASVSILYDKFPLITTMAILGFLFGAIPDMFMDLKSGFKKVSNWVTLAIVVAILLVYNFVIQSRAQITFPEDPSISFLFLMVGIGFITSATFVVPGVDFAVVFLSLGIYYAFTNMILDLVSFGSPTYFDTLIANIKILGFYLIGYLLGVFLISKLIKALSHKYESQTKFASFGFIVASPVIVIKNCIYDNTSFNIENITRTEVVVGFLLMVTLLWITIKINKQTHNVSTDHPTIVKKETEVYVTTHEKPFDSRVIKTFLFHPLMAIKVLYHLTRQKYLDQSFVERYRFVQKYASIYIKYCGMDLKIYGDEYLKNLHGGVAYIGNHQSRNDGVIITAGLYNKPGSFLVAESTANAIYFRHICKFMSAKVIKFQDLKDQIRVYNQVAIDFKDGMSYAIFPEAMYNDNKNSLIEFHSPCFSPIIKSQCPIVPFVIYDAWKMSDPTIKGRFSAQLHFLKPVMYEDYKNMDKKELASYIKSLIQAKIDELDKGKQSEFERQLELDKTNN